MKKRIDIEVANGVATKKKYVSPEIEVVELDKCAPLLSASVTRSFGAGFEGTGSDDWDE